VIEAVVLAYGPEHYGTVVQALIGQGVPATAITVVQNPKVPGEAPLPEEPAGIRVLTRATNGGYAAAMNAALAQPRHPDTEWMLLLTHDVELDPGAVDALAAAAERAGGFAVLAPTLRWTGEHAIYEQTFGGRWDSDGRVVHLEQAPPRAVDGVAAIDFADGSVLLLRLDAVRDVGFIDERFFLYFEETDLCRRLAAAGWRAGCVLDAHAAQAAGVQKRPGAYAYLHTRNALEFARRMGGPGAAARAAGAAVLRLPLRRLMRRGSTPEVRTAAAQATAGGLAGILAFALRRFGPPPAHLPGMGDVTVARRGR
jgi:GT2 family glycosyltransferase